MKVIQAAIHGADRLPRPLQVGLAMVTVIALGIVDYLTGYEAFFAVFYLFPISFIAWHLGLGWGLGFSLLSATVWVAANAAAGEVHSSVWIPAWNTFTRVAIFSLVTLLLASLRSAHEHERQLARTDYLTGAENKRSFCDLTEREVDRCRRHERPFTIIYADLDNFKSVNDRWGHSTGDALLREVVNAARQELRALDSVARLGGDEFAILLPETGATAGLDVAERLRQVWRDVMRTRDWPVTVSLGVLTCLDPPATFDELLHKADSLMYGAKRSGKDAIRHEVLQSPPGTDRATLPRKRV